MVEKATMESETKATMWKSIKTDSETGVQNDFKILFGATYRKNKQCQTLYHFQQKVSPTAAIHSAFRIQREWKENGVMKY